MAELTQAELKHFVSYDPDTGLFHWKNPESPRVQKGDTAGGDCHGYIRIQLLGRTYGAHRLAWLYVHGTIESAAIDHIDGDTLNNRISNLRPATMKQNSENQMLRPNNRSGFRGVHWVQRNGKWKASVTHNQQVYYLGLFDSLDEASSIAKGARDLLFTHHNTTHSA